MARLVNQMREALAVFAACGAAPALIGGLALAAHNVVRATQDIDFLADSSDAERLHGALLEAGYRCVHRSEDAANYLRGDEGLDFLYAHRPVARRLLEEAEVRETPMGQLRVLSAEGLIGFKLQSHINDPKRSRDLDDIRALLRANLASLNMTEVQGYFALFEREALLDEILREIDG